MTVLMFSIGWMTIYVTVGLLFAAYAGLLLSDTVTAEVRSIAILFGLLLARSLEDYRCQITVRHGRWWSC